MAKIRKIYDQTIKPDGSKTTIYPITSTRAVYTPAGDTLDFLLSHEGIMRNAFDVDGYQVVSSVDDLPEGETKIGYLIKDNLYIWVGTGGDTKNGMYQNCGAYRGPEGASAYEVAVQNGYKGTEEEWLDDPVNGIKGVGIAETEIDHTDKQSGTSTITFKYSNGEEYELTVKNGTGIVSIEEKASDESSGINLWTVKLSDGTSHLFKVKNGRGIVSVTQTEQSWSSDGNNVITVTLSDGTQIPFVVRNGSQGNSGVVTNVQEGSEFIQDLIVNNLTTRDPEKTLSAEQGWVLGSQNNILRSAKNQYLDSAFILHDIFSEGGTLPLEEFNIGSDAKYGTTNSYKHLRLDVSPGDLLYVRTSITTGTRLAFMTNANCPTSGSDVPVVAGGLIWLGADTENLIEVPEGTIIAGINDGQDGSYRPVRIIVYEKKTEPCACREIKTIGCGYYYGIPTEGGSGTLKRASGSFGNNICFRIKRGKRYVANSGSFPGSSECRRCILETLPFVGGAITNGVTQGPAQGGFYAGERANYCFTSQVDGYYMITAFNRDVTIYELDNTISGQNAELDSEIKSIRANEVFEKIDLSDYPERNYTLSDFSCFRYSGSRHKLIPVKYGQRIKVMPNGTNSAYIAFLKDDYCEIEKSPNASELVPYIRYNIPYNQTEPEILTVPKDANYLYVMISTPSYNYEPAYIEISKLPSSSENFESGYEEFVLHRLNENNARSAIIPLTSKTISSDVDGWEIPETIQQDVFIKRIKQLSNIEWTPKLAVPGNHFTKVAGTTYTGIPYSANMQFYKLIGISVSLESFMTAVNNPYSLLYTENVRATNSSSIWGNVYNNKNGYSYYGLVCNSFASAVFGGLDQYGNGIIKKLNLNADTFIPVCAPMTVDFNLLKIGDLVNNGVHCFVIMGLKRDENGEISMIKTAEEMPGADFDCPRILNRSRAYFYKTITTSDEGEPGEPAALGQYPQIISRYDGMYANTSYTPSPFVQIDDEPSQTFVYNNDICTFAGDKVSFGDGELVVLNYNLTDTPAHDWTSIEVYRDDSLLKTYEIAAIDQDALPEGQRGHALNLGKNLSAGKYKARLSDGTNYSDYTYWEVLKANVEVKERADGSFEIVSDVPVSAAMLGYMMSASDDNTFTFQMMHHLNYKERATWKFVIYPKDTLEAFNYLTFSSTSIKLVLVGQYGKALSARVKLYEL